MKSILFWGIIIQFFIALYYFVMLKKHLYLAQNILDRYFSEEIFIALGKTNLDTHFFLLAIGCFALTTFLLGVGDFKEIKKYEEAFRNLGIKQPNGKALKVISYKKINEHKSRVSVFSGGIAIKDLEDKKENIKGYLGKFVESIKGRKDPRIIDLNLTTRVLPKKLNYFDVKDGLNSPYEFIVGESMSGIVSCKLGNPPHCLIAGASGSGKSTFFKTLLISLLNTSENIQLKLFDLKGGVEFKPFQDIPCVSVIKSEGDALAELAQIKEEMNRRYKYLESKGYKEVVPERDNLDRLVIAIDEASVLYTIPRGLKEKKEKILKCRDYTDEISKLGRAAGINIIFATQKVEKSAIDPKTLENVDLRMAFKANSYAGSNNVLGNKKAYELPNICGRGIWRNGNKFIQVQAPYLSDEDLNLEISDLKDKFEKLKKEKERSNGTKDKSKKMKIDVNEIME